MAEAPRKRLPFRPHLIPKEQVDALLEKRLAALRVKEEERAREEEAKLPKPGDRLPDGTVYAGTSPDTGKPMYTTAGDSHLCTYFEAAAKEAKALNQNVFLDKTTWRVPTKGELQVLFNNRAAIGGFNLTGKKPKGWYLSSSSYYGQGTWSQRFSDGSTSRDERYSSTPSSVRFVCG